MTLEMHPQRWGNPAEASSLPDSVRALVDAFVGTRDTPAVSEVALPAPGLSGHVLGALRSALGDEAVLTDDETRRLRTRGKSTPDLLRARSGDLVDAPDAVVRPGSHDDVVATLAWAVEQGVAVVPFGGGTCVTGGLAARRDGFKGLVSLDLVRLDQLVSVDLVSMTAVLQPGMRGPAAESALAEYGLTLGHFPQSFEFASIGGFAVTRSSGQSSAGFGRFDDMVVGLRVATPIGELRAGSSPANAAGPDLREVVMGSEGTLGVVTEVTVRVRPVAEEKVYEAWSFPTFAEGAEAMRRLSQDRILPTVLRLSDEAETMVNLASQSDIGGDGVTGCLMIVGHEGAAVADHRVRVATVLTSLGGTNLGEERGAAWVAGRFHAPYLRDSMLDAGVLVETLETATFWSNRERLYTAVKSALEASLGAGALVLCHISHVYETGCSLYFTVAARQGDEPLEQWLAAKAAASDAMIESGGTITHHHAVGTDHKPWLAREIGPVGVAMLRGLKDAVDPTGILNPGVLIP
ncbi:FAD-binding oxidoreductase [Nocardioides sp.]|uniref:FAD-binding oxidoreductase n=1 Tax=Nocardioides sp. TaxID=35761 RepID=UPI002C6AF5CE|nr:FAD-binding oxidoreductase [Nocardioides sp.]HSX66843.1 FAD-binding oxidoreductase [Nocardioides sp.]